jgi:hypothetical protein
MIASFPVLLLLPGVLFLAAGFFYRDRATRMGLESELGKRLAEGNRRTGNLSIALGIILLVVAVPLGLAIHGLQ